MPSTIKGLKALLRPVLFSNTVCWREVSSAEEAMADVLMRCLWNFIVCQALTQAPYHPLLFTCNPGMSKFKKTNPPSPFTAKTLDVVRSLVQSFFVICGKSGVYRTFS